MSNRRSGLGLDEKQTFLEKLGLFLSVLFLGPLIGVFLVMGVSMANEPWRTIGYVCLETVAVFWVLVLIFIWWRPLWLRTIYLHAERNVLLLVNGILVVGLIASLLGLAVAAIGSAVGFIARWN
jgi:hypothetical protein